MPEVSKYVWDRVSPEPNSGCWLWRAGVNRDGYAVNGSNRFVHRMAYEQVKGPIPEGLSIDHLCRVKCCVNPAHLEPVTLAENNRRTERAQRIICKRGHSLADCYVDKRGYRNCRHCQYLRTKARRARGFR